MVVKTFLQLNNVEDISPIIKNLILFHFAFSASQENLNSYLAKVNRCFNTEYGCVLSLFDLILGIPITSVTCERAFTHMKLVRSYYRTLLNESTLSECLMVKWEGSSIDDFDPDAAINLWFEKTDSRPGSSKSAQNLQGIFILNEGCNK